MRRTRENKTPVAVALGVHLRVYGWGGDQHIERIVAAYENGGVEAAAAEVAWMDDEDHDYSGEMRQCIREWEAEIK